MALAIRAGLEIWSEQFGAGARDALLIHCSLGSSAAWAPLMARLGHQLTATAFDMPGHGQSADWTWVGDYQTQNIAIAASLVDTRVDVIGHSFGATVALRFAQEFPERVRSLVLIEPVYFAAIMGLEACKAHLLEMAQFDKHLDADDPEAAARWFLGQWGDGRSWDEYSSERRKDLIDRIPMIRANYPTIYEDVAGVLSEGRIEAVAAPVLMLEGGESSVLMSLVADAIHPRFGQSTRHVIPGAGHMLPITHAKQTGKLIEEFLGGIAAT